MPNMSYCRFQNTLKDLRECNDHLDDQNLSEDEEAARIALIKLCEIIAETSSS
jgi:hypothetical protein